MCQVPGVGGGFASNRRLQGPDWKQMCCRVSGREGEATGEARRSGRQAPGEQEAGPEGSGRTGREGPRKAGKGTRRRRANGEGARRVGSAASRKGGKDGGRLWAPERRPRPVSPRESRGRCGVTGSTSRPVRAGGRSPRSRGRRGRQREEAHPRRSQGGLTWRQGHGAARMQNAGASRCGPQRTSPGLALTRG